jgi:hypothetical protein
MRVADFVPWASQLMKIESAGLPPMGPDANLWPEDPLQAQLGPQPGWYALSVNEIYGVTGISVRSDKWPYFLEFEPAVASDSSPA